jgi:hypothetical protein
MSGMRQRRNAQEVGEPGAGIADGGDDKSVARVLISCPFFRLCFCGIQACWKFSALLAGRFRMAAMKKRLGRIAVVAMVAALLSVSGVAQDQDDEGPMSDLRFVVVKDYNGKPIRNAAVVLHMVMKGKQAKGGMELKTDNDGRTNIEGIPYGPLRVQVLAPGFQTFGEDYEIDKPELEITVKLKRPGGQYSTSKDAKKAGDTKSTEQKPQ